MTFLPLCFFYFLMGEAFYKTTDIAFSLSLSLPLSFFSCSLLRHFFSLDNPKTPPFSWHLFSFVEFLPFPHRCFCDRKGSKKALESCGNTRTPGGAFFFLSFRAFDVS